MTSQVIHRGDMLSEIYEGMPIFDRYGDKLGTVRYVRAGDESADESTLSDDPRVDNAAKALRARMLKSGFVRINNGLLRRDCYTTADEIARVAEDGVYLNVSKDMLMTL